MKENAFEYTLMDVSVVVFINVEFFSTEKPTFLLVKQHMSLLDELIK